MSDNYAIWKPEYDGHAPPNWREGMKWNTGGGAPIKNPEDPIWCDVVVYRVEAEALNSPNDDPGGYPDTLYSKSGVNDDAKDVKPQDPRKSVHEALAILRGYSADELAKHGITLEPPKDWATELWGEIYQAWHIGGDDAAAEHIRTRFEQMIAERSKRDD